MPPPSLRRGPSRRFAARRWYLAVGLAVAANCAIVLLLARISRPEPAAVAPPLAVRPLHRTAPEPAPPPPADAAPAPPAAAILPMPALPELDLPEPPPALPEPPALAAIAAMPLPDLALPAVLASGVPDAPAIDAAPPPDREAERIGDLDLERFYPRAARARGLAGTSRIRSHIDAAGVVTRVEVLASSPAGVFEQAAESLGRAQRYRPAERGGQPVPSEQDAEIAWTIR